MRSNGLMLILAGLFVLIFTAFVALIVNSTRSGANCCSERYEGLLPLFMCLGIGAILLTLILFRFGVLFTINANHMKLILSD